MRKLLAALPVPAPVCAQLAGGVAAGIGLLMLVGIAWTLLAIGAVTVALATLVEMRSS